MGVVLEHLTIDTLSLQENSQVSRLCYVQIGYLSRPGKSTGVGDLEISSGPVSDQLEFVY